MLIFAENTSARFGGEAILPLHYFRILRRGIETWLVTHVRNRAELAALLPGELDRMRFIPESRMRNRIYRFGRMFPARLADFTTGYVIRMLSQRHAKRLARELIAEKRIELLHQPTPVSPKEPSLMFGLGVPVVIGPMNGGMEFPPGFKRLDGSLTEAWFAVGRRTARRY